MDALGRYYTNDIFSTLLISNLETRKPKRIVDLGVGDASLTIAAYARWDKAKYFATEIEPKKATAIEKKLAFVKVLNCDTLQPNASNKLKVKFGSIDIAICNPPYIRVENKERYNGLFKSVGCKKFSNLPRITSEIVFFAHNLKLLKQDGELGIIVSDSLVTGKEFKIFRETIFEKFNVRRIIQLPDNIFNKTEARTHIIFISKTKSINKTCEILNSNISGELSKKIIVAKHLLIDRMDYHFHSANIHSKAGTKTLKQIGAVIKRGKFSYKELRESKLSFFHSVHFKENGVNISFDKPVAKKHHSYSANEGDILMCRVGKRVVGKVVIVKFGRVVISDCIYRITVPKRYRQVLLKSLRSEEGIAWLHAFAHGVCSQVISKSDLENYPIFDL
jgi:type I restriction-modification system DNA methylase subunit